VQEWNETTAKINSICGMLESLVKGKQPEYLTIKQVCEMLKIQRATFYRYKNNGLKISVIGKKSFVRSEDLTAFLEKGIV
jgi:excisionase family DNA binding protein